MYVDTSTINRMEKYSLVDVDDIFHDLLYGKKCFKMNLKAKSTSKRKNFEKKIIFSKFVVNREKCRLVDGRRQAALFITPKNLTIL